MQALTTLRASRLALDVTLANLDLGACHAAQLLEEAAAAAATRASVLRDMEALRGRRVRRSALLGWMQSVVSKANAEHVRLQRGEKDVRRPGAWAELRAWWIAA
jgi:hypothetical protein